MRTYKTEIKPTEEQKRIIQQTIGVCRYIYNFYIAHNKEVYVRENRFVQGMEFSKWLNNDFIPNNQEYVWIKSVSSKAVKQSIMNAEKAFKRFFKKQAEFPRFKKKGRSNVKAYFPQNNKTDWIVERHRVKIPTIGFVRLKEKNYIPIDAKVKSGTISTQAGRYYVAVTVEESLYQDITLNPSGIGIDLGIKEFAIMSDGYVEKNINKSSRVKKLEKKLRRQQRKLSRKYESLKHRNKILEGEATRQNIQKQVLSVQKLHQTLSNIRTDHINKCVAEVVRTKPQFVTIEDLNVRGMMKNRHLSKAVSQQKFFEFRSKLESKCRQSGIELRIADRWFPSSKMCHSCGCIKTDLKLSDREYVCECGYHADRDFNASLNLRDTVTYKLA